MRRATAVLFVACVVLLGAGIYIMRAWLGEATGAVSRIEGVDGPNSASEVRAGRAARIGDFEHGGPHRLAILVTEPSSAWLGLVRLFRSHGIPLVVTEDSKAAFQHKVVLIYPIISGRSLSGEALREVAQHVHTGGTVLGFDLAGGGLEPLFGVTGAVPSRKRNTLHWLTPTAEPEEAITQFSLAGSETELGSYAFPIGNAEIVARYEDGQAAITCRRSVGKACLMGVDLGDLAQRAMDGRAEPLARSYVNQYEPSLDVLARWVRDLYVAGEPTPFLIDTAPPGREVSIVLSHDIDFKQSVANARGYAEFERDAGVKATYFVQTKYVRDNSDDIFFMEATIPDLRFLHDAGMEIASHTVAHSEIFKSFPPGTGSERYSTYQPFVMTPQTARGGTLFGETRVSKFLLEHATGGHVTSFRPGHLSYPFNLPEVLEATGYSFSSSIPANATLTHLPFQMTHARAGQSLALVWEFPITIEDELAPRLGDRIDAANEVIRKIAINRGLVVVLIHPDILDHKLAFERAVVARWSDTAWFTDLNTYGAWWRARDQASIDLVDERDGQTLVINAPLELNGLTILLPKSRAATARDQRYQLANGRLSIERLQGESRIHIAAARGSDKPSHPARAAHRISGSRPQ